MSDNRRSLNSLDDIDIAVRRIEELKERLAKQIGYKEDYKAAYEETVDRLHEALDRITKADALADELVSSIATHTKNGKPHHPAYSRLFQKLAAYREGFDT